MKLKNILYATIAFFIMTISTNNVFSADIEIDIDKDRQKEKITITKELNEDNYIFIDTKSNKYSDYYWFKDGVKVSKWKSYKINFDKQWTYHIYRLEKNISWEVNSWSLYIFNIVSKTRLQNKINISKYKNKDNYTEESWENLQKSLKNAEEVLKDENSSQEKIDFTADNLENFLNYLKQRESNNKDENSSLEEKKEETWNLTKVEIEPAIVKFYDERTVYNDIKKFFTKDIVNSLVNLVKDKIKNELNLMKEEIIKQIKEDIKSEFKKDIFKEEKSEEKENWRMLEMLLN